MNDTKPNGGPAFPIPHTIADANDPAFKLGSCGMSLRDVFAKEAMHAILLASLQGHCYHKEGGKLGPKDYAKAAYENADAMIAARNS